MVKQHSPRTLSAEHPATCLTPFASVLNASAASCLSLSSVSSCAVVVIYAAA